MPTPTYTALANITLGSSASSVTFSSIPATFRDLVLVSNKKSSSVVECYFKFNGTSTNHEWVRMIANSSGPSSGSFSNNYPTLSITADGLEIIQIMDYSATDKHKTWLLRGTYPELSRTDSIAGRWPNTAAITSIEFAPFSGTFSAGFTASLYGIAS